MSTDVKNYDKNISELQKLKKKKELEILGRGKALVSQISNPAVTELLNKFVNYYDQKEEDNGKLEIALQNILLYLDTISESKKLNTFDLKKIKDIKREIKHKLK